MEVVAAVASIVAIAEAGMKASFALFEVINDWKNAPQELNAVATDLALFSPILEDLGRVLKRVKIQADLVPDRAVQNCLNTSRECETLINEINVTFDIGNAPARQHKIKRAKWIFNKAQCMYTWQSRLSSLKASITMQLSVLILEERLFNKTEDVAQLSVAETSKLRGLLEAKKRTRSDLEQAQKHHSKDNLTDSSDLLNHSTTAPSADGPKSINPILLQLSANQTENQSSNTIKESRKLADDIKNKKANHDLIYEDIEVIKLATKRVDLCLSELWQMRRYQSSKPENDGVSQRSGDEIGSYIKDLKSKLSFLSVLDSDQEGIIGHLLELYRDLRSTMSPISARISSLDTSYYEMPYFDGQQNCSEVRQALGWLPELLDTILWELLCPKPSLPSHLIGKPSGQRTYWNMGAYPQVRHHWATEMPQPSSTCFRPNWRRSINASGLVAPLPSLRYSEPAQVSEEISDADRNTVHMEDSSDDNEEVDWAEQRAITLLKVLGHPI